LLTCLDHLTGWGEAIPIASKKSSSVQEAFLTNIVARYGVPTVLISDNGGEFTSTTFERWLREFGVSHHLTSPYHPQSNGMTERFNGTIQRLLLKLTGGDSRKWSKHLPEALYAHRITQGSSGLSPYQAVYGQKPRLPRSTVPPQDERLRAIRQAERTLREFRSQQRNEYRRQEPRSAKRLQPGVYVSVRVLNPKKGQTRWQPGYQVVSSHDGALRVIELCTGTILRLNQRHVRELPESKPYDEVDPIPLAKPSAVQYPPPEAKPVPQNTTTFNFLPTHMPVAAIESVEGCVVFPHDDWSSWLDYVHIFM
jgi:transposase InsO family protein